MDGIYERVGAIAQNVLWNTRNGSSRPLSSRGGTSFEEMVEQRAQMQAKQRAAAYVEAANARRDRIQAAYAECRARGMSDDEFFARWDGEHLEVRADLDDGAEIRFYHDGLPVFGEEPSGYYPDGVSYEHRFWVDGPGEGAVSRVYEFEGGLR